MSSIKLFAALAPITIIVDVLWIGVLMKSFYLGQIGEIARREGGSLTPRWGAALLVYLVIPAGLILFVRPLLAEESRLITALIHGAIFGFILYGVYDFTNLATLEKWTVRMTLVDVAWGMTLCGSMSVVMALLERWLAR
ncbi:DUF2177 family protein [Lacipirellula parvula]|uniref:DUF2177 domain-containing protein n=1 Tax=Lacipirellula parvula TaxID=2650471 RepID=A0A5K7XDZ0_9BACT|nr:DUF2177 family protein [Lacipirellula parvula]BBO34615.1 hypothetical protein PLANPX_4227 [Lacipirellula parvula]